MKSILLLGAPGTGKGTVAEAIVRERGFEHLSTGDMLRESVRKGDELGKLAKGYMDRGELLPDDIIENIITARMDRGGPDSKYLFDGYPRTLVQAESFEKTLAKRGEKINAVVQLDVPHWLIIRRLSGRRSCKKCGAVYNISTQKPKVEGICDNCGDPLIQRADDEEATVRNRLLVYEKQTEPLINFYKSRGILKWVDSTDRLETDNALLRIIDEVT